MTTENLVKSSVTKNFLEFSEAFDDIMSQKIEEKISAKYDDMMEVDITESYFAEYDALTEDLIVEGLFNPAFAAGQKFAEFGELAKSIRSGAIPKKQAIDAVKDMYSRYEGDLKAVKQKYEKFLKANTRKFKNFKILAQLKPVKSLADKVGSRGKPLDEINDLVRGAVLFQTKDDADKFVADLRRKNADKIVEFEKKEKGGDLTYGYFGTYHLLVDIDGILCEIQVATKKLWSAKSAAHQIYDASRSSSTGPTKADQYLSKKIFSRGNLGEEAYDPEEFE